MIMNFFRNNKDLSLVLGMVLILIVLFSPIPPAFLDLAIIINFGLGLTILLLTFYVIKPVDFSTFPSLLLISTLYRLSLNVAATRLILTGGDAGQVIGSIGSFAVSGNFIVGLVVFSILIVVQYIVVTSGAQRVSEVAARFTLDSMPGQQMSIDADLNMGLIDQKEALRRRQSLEKEASFYGAMDGASKFVKGDAIAGIIILLIDIIAGWIIGVVQMGMGLEEALQHFTLLTIGDGIATQLPALIISIATGIIVTRSSADRELSTEVFKQLLSVPKIPFIVCGILVLLLLLPGMPKWPLTIPVSLAVFYWWRLRRQSSREETEFETQEEAAPETLSKQFPLLEVALGSELSDMWKNSETLIMDRIASLRQAQENRLGIGFPPVKIADGAQIGSQEYEIRLFGTRYAAGQIIPGRVLAIRGDGVEQKPDGIETSDPVFGLPAVWVDETRSEEVRQAGLSVIDRETVLITHLGEVMRHEADTLLTRATVVKLLEEVRERQGGLVEELIPTMMSVSDVQRVLQNCLAEGVSIANLDLIFEHLVDLAREEKNPNQLTELLRQRLGHMICNSLRERHKELAVISMDPRIENQILSSFNANANKDSLAIEPKLAEKLIKKLVQIAGNMHQQGRQPVLLCGNEIRRQLRSITKRSIPKLSVLSVGEIPTNISLKSFDIVKLDN